MIIGIGTDIIEIVRIDKALKRFKQRFEHKIFTPYEQRYARDAEYPAARYAKRFAAKEAFFKALGTTAQEGTSWHDVEIRNEASGQPFITISDRLSIFLNNKYGEQALTFHVTLSDTATLAQALVIIDRKLI